MESGSSFEMALRKRAPQSWKKRGNGFSLEAHRGSSLAHIVVLAREMHQISGLQNYKMINIHCFKMLRLGNLLQGPQKTNTHVNLYLPRPHTQVSTLAS